MALSLQRSEQELFKCKICTVISGGKCYNLFNFPKFSVLNFLKKWFNFRIKGRIILGFSYKSLKLIEFNVIAI